MSVFGQKAYPEGVYKYERMEVSRRIPTKCPKSDSLISIEQGKQSSPALSRQCVPIFLADFGAGKQRSPYVAVYCYRYGTIQGGGERWQIRGMLAVSRQKHGDICSREANGGG